MVWPLFCRRLRRYPMRDVSNWILFIFCTFTCYFGLMGMANNFCLLECFVDGLVILIFVFSFLFFFFFFL